jgi:hypothetical protein
MNCIEFLGDTSSSEVANPSRQRGVERIDDIRSLVSGPLFAEAARLYSEYRLTKGYTSDA